MGRLALVQPRSVRVDFTVPWRRVGLIAAAVAALLALLYVVARETPAFAVQRIDVTGGSNAARKAVRTAAAPVMGNSLFALDGEGLVGDLEALPTVRSVTYDRAFPNTLRIFVTPEHPLAIVRFGPDRWVISDRGRIIRRYEPEPGVNYPRFKLPARPNVVPGSFVEDPGAKAMLRALTLVPKGFPAEIHMVRLQGGLLTMDLRAPWGEPELRLGADLEVQLKLAVAKLVLRSLSAEERLSTGYLDVSVPERTVVGSNSQVSG